VNIWLKTNGNDPGYEEVDTIEEILEENFEIIK